MLFRKRSGIFLCIHLQYFLLVHVYAYISEHIMVSHNGIPRVKMNALVCLSFFDDIVKLVKHTEFFLKPLPCFDCMQSTSEK